MVAAAENMQAFGWDLFSGNRDSVFLGSGSIAGDELDISSFVPQSSTWGAANHAAASTAATSTTMPMPRFTRVSLL